MSTPTGLYVIGLSGGCSPERPLRDGIREPWHVPPEVAWLHDAAAVLICDGQIVAGVEEERLNRLKHTNKLAQNAIRACLKLAGLTLNDITRFAYYGTEDILDAVVASHVLRQPNMRPFSSAREYVAAALNHDLGADIDPARIVFVEHHLAHAS